MNSDPDAERNVVRFSFQQAVFYRAPLAKAIFRARLAWRLGGRLGGILRGLFGGGGILEADFLGILLGDLRGILQADLHVTISL